MRDAGFLPALHATSRYLRLRSRSTGLPYVHCLARYNTIVTFLVHLPAYAQLALILAAIALFQVLLYRNGDRLYILLVERIDTKVVSVGAFQLTIGELFKDSALQLQWLILSSTMWNVSKDGLIILFVR
jgi:hypothetical protein